MGLLLSDSIISCQRTKPSPFFHSSSESCNLYVVRPTESRNLQHARFSRILEAMEIHFTPDVEKKLNDLAAQSGRGPDELLKDALAGYLDELVQTGDMLNNRYDELKSGRVKPIDGEEAFARLKAKTQAQRKQPA